MATEFEVQEAERKLNESAIQSLVAELDEEEAEIRTLYQQAYDKLNKDARIKDYLSIFVVREVRGFFEHHRPPQHGIKRENAPAPQLNHRP